jgi:hypothetical protein
VSSDEFDPDSAVALAEELTSSMCRTVGEWFYSMVLGAQAGDVILFGDPTLVAFAQA